MSRKKALSLVTLLIAIIGIGFAMSPFLIALNPPSHLPEYAKGFDINGMKENSVKAVHIKGSKKVGLGSGSMWEPGDALVIVRGEGEAFYLYWVPTWEQQFLMPISFWGQHEGYCRELGVKVSLDQKVIKCLSTKSSKSFNKEWIWSLNGQGLGRFSPDLHKINFRVEEKVLYAYLFIK
ncbi:hypothetical protein H0A36_11475 [Endozoicomonas sp. SM1973]|uniref:Uncharacterized protein n=1 Tax=Spartinivicinus marinus TaxID=2994442 RepID=A0A853I1Y9_9GAMM|nr:hypothetical protein [Spartinivicinus marinus]MCX4027673.1 hypothetical protein [Spartinivicinus marinus]NYZ66629.1 hypothetical protein [Spartinivicinus marinus]